MKVGARAALREPVLSLLARPRQADIAAGLDKQVAGVLELQRRMKLPSLDTMDPVAARAFIEDGLSLLEVDSVAMAHVTDGRIPHAGSRHTDDVIPVRIFEPRNASPHWLVYFHGGGGVVGSAKGSERTTRLIADLTRCTVASVDYRLGPEHKHPAAIEDAIRAASALRERIPRGGKLVVGGDSFGGFLAAHVARVLHVDAQLLIYPITDLTLRSPGFTTHGEGFLYTKAIAAYFKHHYLNADDDREAASLASWPDLAGAAPAIVVTAGFDPLCPEGDAHAARLAAVTRVVHRRYPSLVHSFLSLAGGVRAARAAIDEMCQDLCELLAP